MEMNEKNMDIFDAVKSVPDNAKKKITDGRMKGMTDISPMWRIQKLTEVFGPCGIGWWYVIKDQRLEPGANGTVKAFVDIDLYYKLGDTVSQPIPGTGGNSFIAREKGGLYTNDECYKMSLSDAISVAAKALGVGADVYMGGDRTKYSGGPSEGEGRSYNYQGRRDDPKGNNYPPAPNMRYDCPQGGGAKNQTAAQRQRVRFGEEEGADGYGAFARSGSGMKSASSDEALPINPVTGPDGYYYCADCGGIIRSKRGKDGSLISAAEVAAIALKRYGSQLCGECMKKREGVE